MTTNPTEAAELSTDLDGRAYVHERCQKSTVISGDDWVGLCNPFAQTGGTICSHCGTASPVKEFAWLDTQENVLKYVRRQRRQTPMLWRMWFWWLGPLCGAALIALVLYFVGPLLPLKEELPRAGWAAVGAFFGVFLAPFAITPWLVPSVTGIEFHRQP